MLHLYGRGELLREAISVIQTPCSRDPLPNELLYKFGLEFPVGWPGNVKYRQDCSGYNEYRVFRHESSRAYSDHKQINKSICRSVTEMYAYRRPKPNVHSVGSVAGSESSKNRSGMNSWGSYLEFSYAIALT